MEWNQTWMLKSVRRVSCCRRGERKQRENKEWTSGGERWWVVWRRILFPRNKARYKSERAKGRKKGPDNRKKIKERQPPGLGLEHDGSEGGM